MSLKDTLNVPRADLEPRAPAQGLPDDKQCQSQRNALQRVPAVAAAVTVNLDRRRFLVGGAVAGIGGVAAAAIHDGELGAPPQTLRGSVPWQEGTADAPPGASGSGYVFFGP